MKRKSQRDPNYEMPLGRLVRIADTLPPPDKLIMPQRPVKVTIALNQSSIDFFKTQAKKHHTKYQRMIREVLDRYTAQYQSRA